MQFAYLMYAFAVSPSGFNTVLWLVYALIRTQLEQTIAHTELNSPKDALRIIWIYILKHERA